MSGDMLPVVETLPDTNAILFPHDNILSLTVKYTHAQVKYLRTEREISKLAAEGNHKRKNKIIHSQLRKASMARNVALRNIERFLNAAAKDQVDQKAIWNDV
jgi:hypothetical protein